MQFHDGRSVSGVGVSCPHVEVALGTRYVYGQSYLTDFQGMFAPSSEMVESVS